MTDKVAVFQSIWTHHTPSSVAFVPNLSLIAHKQQCRICTQVFWAVISKFWELTTERPIFYCIRVPQFKLQRIFPKINSDFFFLCPYFKLPHWRRIMWIDSNASHCAVWLGNAVEPLHTCGHADSKVTIPICSQCESVPAPVKKQIINAAICPRQWVWRTRSPAPSHYISFHTNQRCCFFFFVIFIFQSFSMCVLFISPSSFFFCYFLSRSLIDRL